MKIFLDQYTNSTNLDNQIYNKNFPNGKQRSDYLLFDDKVICEHKEILTFNIRNRVEIASKKNLSEQNLRRDIYTGIEKSLRTANQQIKDTKKQLDLPHSMGLVVLQNRIPEDISLLTLIDAANRKMMNGLSEVDAVLCIDFINTFSDPSGKSVQPIQIVVRNTENSNQLNKLVNELVNDFSIFLNRPLEKNCDILKGELSWTLDRDGKFKEHKASIIFSENKSQT